MISLSINNFRGFQNQEINLSNFSLLIGENCSGKSSLLKFLLAMKQSLEPPNDQESNFTFSGDYADLGSYRESVFNHQNNRRISFKFTFRDDYFKFYKHEIPSVARVFELEESNSYEKRILRRDLRNLSLKYISDKIDKETTVKYQFSSELDKHSSIKTVFYNKNIGELRILHKPTPEAEDNKYFYLQGSFCDLSFKSYYAKKTFLLKNVRFDKAAFMSIIYGLSLRESIIRDYKGLTADEVKEIFFHISYLLITQNYLTEFLQKIEYINPLASQPERIFLKGDVRRKFKFNNIEKVVKMLDKNSQEDTGFIQLFSNLLAEFGVADDILLRSDIDLPVQELRIKINDIWSNIADVGYGVVLQLPIIFEALSSEYRSKDNRILVIEQPEVHVHPRLQARLIEVLCKLNKNTSYIIETHSEHIIRKLQTIVRNEKYQVKSEDVTITYFIKKGKHTLMQKHSIEKNGALLPKIPSGFFDSTFLLAKELIS